MKKITICLIATCLLLTISPFQSRAETTAAPSSLVGTLPATPIESAEAAKSRTLMLRLIEINEMDKSNLSSMEKKSLRKEVRSIKSQMYANGGGVYISVGGLIIILILLIILF